LFGATNFVGRETLQAAATNIQKGHLRDCGFGKNQLLTPVLFGLY